VHKSPSRTSDVVVIWIDWYPYHVARFRGLANNPSLRGRVTGVELVGGVGVHQGLKFREDLPTDLPVITLMPEHSWRDVSQVSVAVKLWKQISALDPEFVLIPGYYTLPGLAAAIWARVHQRTSVLMTESTAIDHKRVFWKELLKGFGMRVLFDWAIAGGRAHFDYLRQLGFKKTKIVGAYNVVDNDFFSKGADALRSAALFQHSQPYFLFVGRLAAEKNVRGLLNSWLSYRRQGGSWPLVLVGEGPEASALKATAVASEFAAEVYFPGLKTCEQTLPFYAHAGCFVLPSTREPWGLVTNEAMAAGLPVLISDRCGCAADLVASGENGFVFPAQDEQSLKNLLHHVESLPLEERARMGMVSKQMIENFSPAHFGRSVEVIVRSGINSSRRDAMAHTSAKERAGGNV
jgi:1,2-diacylglycerol 3-alpha-glucosyltransferase